MSHHPQQLGLFDPVQPHLPMRDVHPATDKQIGYARSLAAKTGAALPHSILHDRAALSAWIDKTKVRRSPGRFSNYPSAKQVQLAERLARLKQRRIPEACFKDRTLMSRWIDGIKPR